MAVKLKTFTLLPTKALHRNRKWRPLPACQDESQQQQQQPWWLACCGCLGPISGHHLHAGWPQWPTEWRWTGPTYNTVLASSRRCTDVRSYHWR